MTSRTGADIAAERAAERAAQRAREAFVPAPAADAIARQRQAPAAVEPTRQAPDDDYGAIQARERQAAQDKDARRDPGPYMAAGGLVKKKNKRRNGKGLARR